MNYNKIFALIYFSYSNSFFVFYSQLNCTGVGYLFYCLVTVYTYFSREMYPIMSCFQQLLLCIQLQFAPIILYIINTFESIALD